MNNTIAAALSAINRISTIPTILELICQAAGARFACIARVTDDAWTACAVRDKCELGVKRGDHLDLATTLCREVRDSRTPIVIDHASMDPSYCTHPAPRMYGFESYISVPIYRQSGEYFGNLCALDPRPLNLSDPKLLAMMEAFSGLISLQLDAEQRHDDMHAAALPQQEHAPQTEKTHCGLDSELAFLRNLFDRAPGFMAVLHGPRHVVGMVNQAYYALFGPRDFIGKPIWESLPEIREQYAELLDRVFETGQAFVGREMKVLQPDDHGASPRELYLDFLVQPIVAPDGTISGLFIQGNDITEQKRVQDELRVSNERLKLAIEGAGDGVWDWNISTNEVVFSGCWKDILGCDAPDVPNAFEEWRKLVHSNDFPQVHAALQSCLDGSAPSYHAEYRMQHKDQSWKWLLARGIVVARDADGKPLRMTGTITDISEKRRSDELIWRHANFDALTGLPNRRLFRDRLDQEVKKAHRSGMQVALLFIDLDRFKEVNELLGHDIGDGLLIQAARRLSSCLRESDTVARLGGDEFTVILAELDNIAHVEQISQKILESLAQPFFLGSEVAYLSASIGITLYPDDGGSAEELIRNADQAMYAAKSAGRNQFSYFTRSMQEQAHARLRLSGDLRNALAAGQLKVFYQPVVDLTTGRIVKAEALLRWNHPGLGPVDPSQFIPIAEESGVINEIGDWVFREAARCSQRWSAQFDTAFQIGVNKSPAQFLSHSKEADWLRYLQHMGLPGKSIAVEITEGLLLNASTSVAEQLLEYRDAGIQVAIDDFGTGYSSMAYLKKFNIDYLKIDQSFVRDMARSPGDRAIAESIIAMAHKLGLKVIAEGIETVEQKELLSAAGCDFGQGYLFAKATPPEEFEQILAHNLLNGSPRTLLPM